MRDASLDFLGKLITAPSPSGWEKAAADLYRNYIRPHCDTVETDVHGNCTAILNPDAPFRLMLSGHMDEIGFIIHYIDDNGLLYFSPVGGHDSPVPLGHQVWVHGHQRVAGAVGRKAIHLQTPEEQSRKPKLNELWIDIGASSREEAERVAYKGAYVTYQHEFRRLEGNRVTGRAFDNKAGLFIVAEAVRILREEGGLHPDVGVFALGTVQEEIGSRGAEVAASRISPQAALAVEMEQAIDYSSVLKSDHGDLALGKGASVSRGPNTNSVVFELLLAAGRESDIPVQVQVAPSTTPTDEKAIQTQGSGVATGLVGVPLRYMHTPCEVIDLSDVDHCIQLIVAFCRKLRPETDFAPF